MRPGPRRSLTHPEILDAAFELLETKGFDAVSVRGVAGALGLTPTAMYTYYPNKQALLAGMVEQLLGALRVGGGEATTDAAGPSVDPANVDPRERVHALARDLRTLLAERRGAVGLLLAAPLDGPNATRMDEELLAAFTEAGLDLVGAGRAAHAVRVHVLGAVAFDAAHAAREAEADAETGTGAAGGHAAASDTLWDDLESFPLAERSRDLDDDPAERFAWGLDRLLDGLLAR